MELTRLESVPESPPSRRRVPYTQARPRRQPWRIGPAGGIPRSTVIAFDSCVSRESQPKLRVVGVDDHILLHEGVLLGMPAMSAPIYLHLPFLSFTVCDLILMHFSSLALLFPSSPCQIELHRRPEHSKPSPSAVRAPSQCRIQSRPPNRTNRPARRGHRARSPSPS